MIFVCILQIKQGYLRLQAMIRSRILTARFNAVRSVMINLQVMYICQIICVLSELKVQAVYVGFLHKDYAYKIIGLLISHIFKTFFLYSLVHFIRGFVFWWYFFKNLIQDCCPLPRENDLFRKIVNIQESHFEN